MSKLLFDFRFVIVFILCMIIFAIFERERFVTKVNAVMLCAKQLAKDKVLKTGKEQEDFVVIKILDSLPRWLSKAIPEDILRKIIKYLYNQAMDYIDDGLINDSFGGKDEKY